MDRMTTTVSVSSLDPKLPPFVGDGSGSRPRATVRRWRSWVLALGPVALATIAIIGATEPKIPAAAGD